MISARWFGDIPKDGFNLKHKRNIRNTCKDDYNCGGYALGIFSWYLPIFAKDRGTDKDYWIDRNLDYYIQVMLAEFPTLRVINSIEELQKDEYAIAFRTANDAWEQDFHFLKRAKNGQWFEKRGSLETIFRVSKTEVFNNCWNGRYRGKIILFAKKY